MKLTVPEQHRLKIARQTLKMPEVMIRIMGGMTAQEAIATINELARKRKAGKEEA